MTKYILHGGFAKDKNKLNDGYYKEIVQGVPDGGTILVIHFARPDEEIPERFEGEKARLLVPATNKNVTISLASKDDFINQIRQADAVVIDSGDTQKLMRTLQQFQGFSKALRGKTVAGTSAGAYILSKYYHSASTDKIHKGFGFVPVRIICHFESDKFETRGKPLEQMKKYSDDSELVILRDCEWQVFTL